MVSMGAHVVSLQLLLHDDGPALGDALPNVVHELDVSLAAVAAAVAAAEEAEGGVECEGQRHQQTRQEAKEPRREREELGGINHQLHTPNHTMCKSSVPAGARGDRRAGLRPTSRAAGRRAARPRRPPHPASGLRRETRGPARPCPGEEEIGSPH